MKRFYFFFSLFLVFSCHRQSQSTQTTPQLAVSEAPQILFLQFKVSKKEATYEAKITSKKAVAGILDRDLGGLKLFENQWLISFLDDKKNVLEQVVVPNPLDEHFEVADDKGVFKGVEVKKNEAEFFCRVQSNPKFSSLQVEQILQAQKKEKLFSLNF